MQKELGIESGFKDHFSDRSEYYAEYRPSYPDELFSFLAAVAPGHDAAWDCATGNGQAAVALAGHFKRVVATDASQAQISAALAHSRVEYGTASAEDSEFEANVFDLLTVAQAFHWFDAERFFAEAARVLRPDGILALWSYRLCSVNKQIDAIVLRLYEDIVAKFWPPERAAVEQDYAKVVLPGVAVKVPPLRMSPLWQAADMVGYLRTWSACRYYESTHGTDPVDTITADLECAWGAAERAVSWPLNVKVRRLNSVAGTR